MIRLALQRIGILTLAALLISPLALAQPQNADLNDETPPEEIEQVAEVLIEIEEVRHTYQQKIQNTRDEDQIRTYQQQMAEEIDRVVKEYDGLTMKRYEEITQAAQSDSELKQEILSLVKEKSGKEASR